MNNQHIAIIFDFNIFQEIFIGFNFNGRGTILANIEIDRPLTFTPLKPAAARVSVLSFPLPRTRSKKIAAGSQQNQ
jgi:hypothetical protein